MLAARLVLRSTKLPEEIERDGEIFRFGRTAVAVTKIVAG